MTDEPTPVPLTGTDGSNSTTRAILRRRSTREGFVDRPVSVEVLAEIVSCGLAAPSSKDAQPWSFHIVTDHDRLARIADLVSSAEGREEYVPHDPLTGRPGVAWQSTVLESADVLRCAPTAVFVENRGVFGGGRRRLVIAPIEHVAASVVGYGLELLGIGAAIQNMLIAAGSLQVQAAFMGDILIAEERIRDELGIKGDLVGVLVLGYSAEVPPPRERSALMSDLVHWH